MRERRHVTVKFCDLVDSTGIAGKLDAEEWRDLVGAYLDACCGNGRQSRQELGEGLMAAAAMVAERAQRAVRVKFKSFKAELNEMRSITCALCLSLVASIAPAEPTIVTLTCDGSTTAFQANKKPQPDTVFPPQPISESFRIDLTKRTIDGSPLLGSDIPIVQITESNCMFLARAKRGLPAILNDYLKEQFFAVGESMATWIYNRGSALFVQLNDPAYNYNQ